MNSHKVRSRLTLALAASLVGVGAFFGLQTIVNKPNADSLARGEINSIEVSSEGGGSKLVEATASPQPASSPVAEKPPDNQLKGVQGIGASVKLQSEKLKTGINCDPKKLLPEFAEFCEAAQACVGSVEAIPVQVGELSIDRALLVVAGGVAKVSGLGSRTMEAFNTKVKAKSEVLTAKVDKAKGKAGEVQTLVAKGESIVSQTDQKLSDAVSQLGHLNPSGAAEKI